MRLVLDTNVLVSAALKQQSAPGMAVLVVERHHILFRSPATEEQLFAVVARPYLVSLFDTDTRAGLTKLLADAEPATINERIITCRDPTHDKFSELAINGHADLIVSGGADLLGLNPLRHIPIVPPADFVAGLAR